MIVEVDGKHYRLDLDRLAALGYRFPITAGAATELLVYRLDSPGALDYCQETGAKPGETGTTREGERATSNHPRG